MCFSSILLTAGSNDPSSAIVLSPKVSEQARYIARHATTDSDKAHVLFLWLSDHIAYDVKAASHVDGAQFSELQNPETVLRRGKAVCQGYAATYSAFLDALGIQNYIVVGDARTAEATRLEAHSWNAIYLDGKWQLADPSWAAGGVNNGVFIKDYRSEYFLAAPSDLIKTHLPDDPMWQLLDQPVSRAHFVARNFLADGQSFYNYQSDLSQYITLDPTSQNEIAIERALNFNPENTSALYELGVLRFDASMRAASAFEEMTAYLTQPEEYLTIRDSLLTLLDQQQALLTESEKIFKQLHDSDADIAISAQENLRVIRSVVKNINFERRLLSEL